MQKSIFLFLCCLLHYHWLIFEMMRKDNCCVHLSFLIFSQLLLNVIIISLSLSQLENCCWASLNWQTFVTLCCYFALFWFDLFAGRLCRRRRRNLILCFVNLCVCLLFLVMPAKDCQTAETKEWKDWRDQCLIFFDYFYQRVFLCGVLNQKLNFSKALSLCYTKGKLHYKFYIFQYKFKCLV